MVRRISPRDLISQNNNLFPHNVPDSAETTTTSSDLTSVFNNVTQVVSNSWPFNSTSSVDNVYDATFENTTTSYDPTGAVNNVTQGSSRFWFVNSNSSVPFNNFTQTPMNTSNEESNNSELPLIEDNNSNSGSLIIRFAGVLIFILLFFFGKQMVRSFTSYVRKKCNERKYTLLRQPDDDTSLQEDNQVQEPSTSSGQLILLSDSENSSNKSPLEASRQGCSTNNSFSSLNGILRNDSKKYNERKYTLLRQSDDDISLQEDTQVQEPSTSSGQLILLSDSENSSNKSPLEKSNQDCPTNLNDSVSSNSGKNKLSLFNVFGCSTGNCNNSHSNKLQLSPMTKLNSAKKLIIDESLVSNSTSL